MKRVLPFLLFVAVVVFFFFCGQGVFGQSPPTVVKARVGDTIQIVPADDVTPQPQPEPLQPALKFVVIEETSKAGQFRADLLTSPKVQQYVLGSKIAWRIVDKDSKADDVAKQMAELGANPLPRLFLVDSAGNTVKSLDLPKTPDAFIEALKPAVKEDAFRLGNLAPVKALDAKWVKVGDPASPVPLIPRAQWKPISLEAFLPPVRNQGDIGKCNATATVAAFETARNIAGLSPQRLSDDYLYGNIVARDQFGRRLDRGSFLEDGMSWMLDNGTCLNTTVKNGNWNPPAWPASAAAEAKDFTTEEVFLCQNFDAVVSAIQQGFPVVVGVLWYKGYFQTDSEGWIFQQGQNVGGHAIMAYGYTERNGQRGVRCRNSWGTEWGIGGNFVLPEWAFTNQVGGFWAIRSVKQTRVVAARGEDVAFPNPFRKIQNIAQWAGLLKKVRDSVNPPDWNAIANAAAQLGALLGYDNVGQDVELIIKACVARDWAGVIDPLTRIIKFGITQFPLFRAEEGQADEAQQLLKSLEDSRPKAMSGKQPVKLTPSGLPAETAPAGKQWIKYGDGEWELRDAPPVQPAQMIQPAYRPALPILAPAINVVRQCVNGVCK